MNHKRTPDTQRPGQSGYQSVENPESELVSRNHGVHDLCMLTGSCRNAKTLMKEAASLLKSISGCRTVAFRFKGGGFELDELLSDSCGSDVLQGPARPCTPGGDNLCLCDLMIEGGSPDWPALSSETGSRWTEDAKALEFEPILRAMFAAGRCVKADFRTFALFPLTPGGPSRGFVLIADQLPGLVPASAAAALEQLVAMVGTALDRIRGEDGERRGQRLLRIQGLGDLTVGAAHEFNNILMGISASAEVELARAEEASGTASRVERILTLVDRAAQLVRQMGAMGDTGPVELAEIAVDQLISRCLNMVKSIADERCLFQQEIENGVPPVVGHASSVQNVFVNLLDNATKACRATAGRDCRIRVVVSSVVLDCAGRATRWGETLEGGEYVVFEVSDTGCGMSPETIERAFDPFYRFDFSGSGLGLSEVFGVVRSHGGSVDVESEMGQGTTVQVLLPAGTRSSEQLGVVAEQPEAAQGIIIVADDEEAIRSSAADLLEMLGYQCLTAADSNEAMQLLEAHRGQVVAAILDIKMPEVTGIEVLLSLRAVGDHTSILLTSGNRPPDLDETLGRDDRAGFIQKPFRLADLTAGIQELRYGSNEDETPGGSRP